MEQDDDVMISSMYQERTGGTGQVLARKTVGLCCAGEELVDEARKLGIKIGRLEVAMIKTPGLSEKLSTREGYISRS
jgi:hypothetical protein